VKVVLDTNGLMADVQFGIDIFEELSALGYDEFVVPSAVKDELETLRKKVKGEDKIALAIAQGLIKRCQVVETPRKGSVDDVVLETAKELKAPVLTNDAALRARLKKAGIRTIFVRSRKKLAIE
jgi:rRNA-processing protein FCF1